MSATGPDESAKLEALMNESKMLDERLAEARAELTAATSPLGRAAQSLYLLFALAVAAIVAKLSYGLPSINDLVRTLEVLLLLVVGAGALLLFTTLRNRVVASAAAIPTSSTARCPVCGGVIEYRALSMCAACSERGAGIASVITALEAHLCSTRAELLRVQRARVRGDVKLYLSDRFVEMMGEQSVPLGLFGEPHAVQFGLSVTPNASRDAVFAWLEAYWQEPLLDQVPLEELLGIRRRIEVGHLGRWPTLIVRTSTFSWFDVLPQAGNVTNCSLTYVFLAGAAPRPDARDLGEDWIVYPSRPGTILFRRREITAIPKGETLEVALLRACQWAAREPTASPREEATTPEERPQ